MSVAYLADIQRDPARAIRRQLEAMWQRVDQQAEQSRRTNEQLKSYAAWGKRREPDTSGPGRAA